MFKLRALFTTSSIIVGCDIRFIKFSTGEVKGRKRKKPEEYDNKGKVDRHCNIEKEMWYDCP